MDPKYNLDAYEAIGYAVELYRHEKKYQKCLDEYDRISKGIPFPTNWLSHFITHKLKSQENMRITKS